MPDESRCAGGHRDRGRMTITLVLGFPYSCWKPDCLTRCGLLRRMVDKPSRDGRSEGLLAIRPPSSRPSRSASRSGGSLVLAVSRLRARGV